jgi:hypothetical protein
MTIDPQIQAVLDAMAAQPQPAQPPTLDEVRVGASAGHLALCPPALDMHVRFRGPTVTFRVSSTRHGNTTSRCPC